MAARRRRGIRWLHKGHSSIRPAQARWWTHEELARRLDEHEERFQLVFEAIRQLMAPPGPPEAPRRRLGFPTKDGETP